MRILSFEASLPRELVHRRAVSEVFITDFVHCGNGRSLAGAQWPRWHVFYGSNLPGVDSALVAETLRQAVIVVAHQRGVPLTHKFLLPHMELSVGTADFDGREPVEVVVELDVVDSAGPADAPSSLTVAARFLHDGTEIGTGTASARMLSAAAYERYRQPRAPSSIPGAGRLLEPGIVGHHSIRNVVLGAAVRPLAWPLHIDQSHPIFFDHPLDHAPGMLLLEAARQALRAASGAPDADFSGFRADFFRMVEFNQPVEVTVSLPGPGQAMDAVAVDIVSGGSVLMSLKGGMATGRPRTPTPITSMEGASAWQPPIR
ncbi:ScbA/BarX family gamma-butyrolactone biosynthesis protein [Arthrobacter sp. 35W]|uniref:ScbA/BarX family gamma-butyrolactone biosynthesis protein n=1 Tax=Arthrobacter sp. 35W TaxID=1132441 RepID=UPI0006848DEF|nr:ScbA/BarX family gamma-butyrolactone biosynthesis protein [Arthrobacter sp. 35W]